MEELEWSDPRDGERWLIRVHRGVAPILGREGVSPLVTFRSASAPAAIHVVALEDHAPVEESTDWRLMDLLDLARAGRGDA